MASQEPTRLPKVSMFPPPPPPCRPLSRFDQLAYPFGTDFKHATNPRMKSEERLSEISHQASERLRKGKGIVIDINEEAETRRARRIVRDDAIDINEEAETSRARRTVTDDAIDKTEDAETNRARGLNVTTYDASIYKEALLSARNIVAYVVIFLATIGSTVCLNPPGGLGDNGEAVAGKTISFAVFMIAAYVMVTGCLLTLGLLCGVTPRSQRSQRNTLRLCHALMWVSLGAFTVMLVSGSWIVIPTQRLWIKLAGLFIPTLGVLSLSVYVWSRRVRRFLRSISFCDIHDSDDEESPLVTSSTDTMQMA